VTGFGTDGLRDVGLKVDLVEVVPADVFEAVEILTVAF
jgi:hypothetical protein